MATSTLLNHDNKMKTRKILRLKNYNYSLDGFYFVTICTYKKQEFFNNKKIKEIVEKTWKEIPTHFQEVILDEYIIMPNHIHGIIQISRARHALPLQSSDKKHQLLFVIIGSFKSATSKLIHKFNSNFKWERSYYEHIIRNDNELGNIRKYINENPLKWNIDVENKHNSSRKIDLKEYYEKIYKGNI